MQRLQSRIRALYQLLRFRRYIDMYMYTIWRSLCICLCVQYVFEFLRICDLLTASRRILHYILRHLSISHCFCFCFCLCRFLCFCLCFRICFRICPFLSFCVYPSLFRMHIHMNRDSYSVFVDDVRRTWQPYRSKRDEVMGRGVSLFELWEITLQKQKNLPRYTSPSSSSSLSYHSLPLLRRALSLTHQPDPHLRQLMSLFI